MGVYENDELSGRMEDREEVYSKVIKAGKRTYFLDVRATRNQDYYLTITESKKKYDDAGNVSYSKHKLFLYKEDFEKFMNGLQQAIGFIQEQQGSYVRHNDNENLPDSEQPTTEQEEKGSPLDGEIKIDIDF